MSKAVAKLPDHAARSHSACSPSSAYRFMACPGSVALIATVPPQPESRYAAQGTAAHELIELCLANRQDAAEYIDREVSGFVVDAEMAEAAQVCLDFYRSEVVEGDVVFIEHPFDLASLNPPVPYKGTGDLVRYRPSTKHLLVADYKHGAGVPVEVVGNPQLRSYGLGACIDLEGRGYVVSDVDVAVVQPRAPHPAGPVRRESISAFDLVEWSADLFEGLARTLDPDAPRVPGPHQCKFCAAAAVCPELAAHSLAVAEAEFSGPTITVPPAPETLSPERIGQILTAADVLETWLEAVRAYAHQQLEAGGSVPGWKLVQKRARRKWADEDMAAMMLRTAGLPESDIYTKDIVSPAQAEKLLGAKRKDEIKHLVVAESSGTTLAPAADKRPAITGGAAADFTSLT